MRAFPFARAYTASASACFTRMGLGAAAAAAGCFVAPVAMAGVQAQAWGTVAGVALFAFAGVVVGAEREQYTMGVRRENWFHYCIGIAAVLMGMGL